MKFNSRNIAIILGLLLVCYLLWIFQDIVIYFLTAIVLAIIGRPIVKLLNKIKFGKFEMPAWASAIITLVLMIGMATLLVSLIAPKFISQAEKLTQVSISDFTEALDVPLTYLEEKLNNYSIKSNSRKALENEIAKIVDFSSIEKLFSNLISGIGNLSIGIFSVFFIAFFILKDRQMINNIISTATPDKYVQSILNIAQDTKGLLTRYFVGLIIQVTIFSTTVTLGLTILGIENALLIGVIGGFINLIPYLGPLIAGAIGIIITIATNVELDFSQEVMPMVLKVVSVFVVSQLIDNFLTQPLIFSKSVKAHPLEIFVVIMMAGTISGVLGMVLAIPMYTFLRIVAKEFFHGYKIVQGLTKSLDEHD